MARRQAKKKSSERQKFILTGTLRMHPRGFGFVVLDENPDCREDVFIPRHLTNDAVDGDQVEVAVYPESRKPEKGPEGEILVILKRARNQLVGTISNIGKEQITAYVPILGENRVALVQRKKKQKLKVGDRVVLEIVEWGTKNKPTITTAAKIIGHIDDASSDIPVALEEYDIPYQFSKQTIQEAKRFGKEVQKKHCKNRLDLTNSACFTIDPETAKDFDDALSLTKNRKGEYFLGVHIADVAHYVKEGGHLDKEAKKRGNSTYFPGKCIPMLPEELSNNLCSLKQGVIRLTVSVLMHFDKKGELLDSQIKRSFIRSQKRFTYDEAKAVLEGKKKSTHSAAIKQMAELCQILKKKRNARGSIDFALPELVIVVDDKGNPIKVKTEQYHITHQLVEEFMLKTNETVAIHIEKNGKEQLFRIHEEPEEEGLEDFFSLARSFGFNVGQKPDQKDLQQLFEKVRSSPFHHQLAVAFIRTMKLAFYSPRNVGHYGLALEHYCHFTSPIRRYSDLITQRLLFDEEEDGIDLVKIGEKCSERERISFKAENSVKSLKKHRLLKRWMSEDPNRKYLASITKIKPFGFFFEIIELFLEGFLHVSDLESDYFIFDEKTPMLEGEKTKMRYIVGQEITVQPQEIDLIYLHTNWKLVKGFKRKRKSK